MEGAAAVGGAGISEQTEHFLRLQILDVAGIERRKDVHISRSASMADLKTRHLAEEIAQGWLPRCVFQGRALTDVESVGALPRGSFIQCYLQRPQVREVEPEFFLGWAVLTGSRHGSPPLCSRRQDLAFHSAFAAALAVVWGAYFADAAPFDAFACFALRFFSVLWVAVCVLDFCWPRGTIAT
mmetsp:Transcript_63094/g.137107  ORF Transcript_63094/g.137107 Transcript_63094/m.137107 type:complete len:183 (+) Transcript_63094:45-593(+)